MAPRDLSAIDGIENATAGKSFEDYTGDWLLRHAVERAIEIISEASRSLPPDIQALRPEIHWARVRGIGNILCHAGEGATKATLDYHARGSSRAITRREAVCRL